MTARIIRLVNQKGKAGKATVTRALAGNLAQRGLKMLVVDADPPPISMAWSAAAPEEEPFPAAVVSLAASGACAIADLRSTAKAAGTEIEALATEVGRCLFDKETA